MVIKTFGSITHDSIRRRWIIAAAQPHVAIKLKALFPKIPKGGSVPFYVDETPINCQDLLWFMDRYPLDISPEDEKRLQAGKSEHLQMVADIETILRPNYSPSPSDLKPPARPRNYQATAKDVNMKTERMLLGDDLGLGKTVSGILMLLEECNRPAFVVCPPHLVNHWKAKLEEFTTLTHHEVKTRKPYSLPSADVYIIRYSTIMGWSDVFAEGIAKYVVFDEIQELRHAGTAKYTAARILSEKTERATGLSATPVYNYGDEIFNILDLLKSGCLGSREDFLREWSGGAYENKKVIIRDPAALGTYLRESYLFLRRTRRDVGMELPRVNTIIQNVDYDQESVQKFEEIARVLAIKVTTGSFMERGQAARELDMLARQVTGVSKAKGVAAFVRMLLDAGEPILLGGWHRDVYDIWATELSDFNPVFYTGTESPRQKSESEARFINGKTNLMIMSLRSGIGVDGLQKRCSTVVIGELDWSPKVHEQFIGRIDRPGQEDPVTVYYTVSDSGSDPLIVDLLGLKSSQSTAIIDPLISRESQHTDESRIKLLAERYL